VSDARARIDHRKREVGWAPYVSDRWGNVLSPYWLARSVANMLGYRFVCPRFGGSSWMARLPTAIGPEPGLCPNKEAFRRVCDHPNCDALVYAHKCAGWELAIPVISRDTRQALEGSAALEKLPRWDKETDLVLWDRCAEDTVASHSEHAPVGFSAIELVPESIRRIFYVYSAEGFKQKLCQEIQQARIEHIKQTRPSVEVILSPGSMEEDFAKLVFAPNVLVVSSGSSFGLWATLANTGNVWMPLPYGGFTPYVRPNYHWLTSVPMLTTDVCEKELNLDTRVSTPVRSTYGPVIIKWLQEH
jgi:hypothetical protein